MPVSNEAKPPIYVKPLDEFVQSMVRLFVGLGALTVEWGWSELILQAGWLPHRALPPELVLDARNILEADELLGGFFHSHWPEIENVLRQSNRAAAIDDEAKEAFEECLQAHRLGLYRVSPALLFPHIERVAREALLPNALGGNPAARLSNAVGELGPSEFTMPGVSGVRLYAKLADHLYKQVRTLDEVATARTDAVPNRHAVLHGRVSYTSEKSSLNMLIMADFIFDAISKIKSQPRAALPQVG